MRKLLLALCLLVSFLLAACSEDFTRPEEPKTFSIVMYPSPVLDAAKPQTQIVVSVPTGGHLRMIVWNAQSEIVKTLIDDVLPPGMHSVSWNGTDNLDNPVASGVYYYTATFDGTTKGAGMTLVK